MFKFNLINRPTDNDDQEINFLDYDDDEDDDSSDYPKKIQSEENKLTFRSEKPFMYFLFDLMEDPYEANNLYNTSQDMIDIQVRDFTCK
jgi:hypothetical protein